MTNVKVVCAVIAFALCIIQCDSAAFISEGTIGEPLELSLGSTTEPFLWKRVVKVNNVEKTQYLFPCACNNGSWTDGTHYFGSGAVAQWDGTLRIARYSAADEGEYSVPNEPTRPNLPQSLITVKTKKSL
uniref:Uncharacterized protein n=1 Tax=Plectus sambesii TaxID=2011161 RepID=A0A914XUY7_9BILA